MGGARCTKRGLRLGLPAGALQNGDERRDGVRACGLQRQRPPDRRLREEQISRLKRSQAQQQPGSGIAGVAGERREAESFRLYGPPSPQQGASLRKSAGPHHRVANRILRTNSWLQLILSVAAAITVAPRTLQQ